MSKILLLMTICIFVYILKQRFLNKEIDYRSIIITILLYAFFRPLLEQRSLEIFNAISSFYII